MEEEEGKQKETKPGQQAAEFPRGAEWGEFGDSERGLGSQVPSPKPGQCACQELGEHRENYLAFLCLRFPIYNMGQIDTAPVQPLTHGPGHLAHLW